MLATIPPYVDGWYGTEQELTVIPKPLFPFRSNPIASDIYSRLYGRVYQVQPRLFLPKIANRTSWSNLVTYSEELDNAAWTKTNLTVTANQGTAPDGQTTLDKALETVTNGEHSVSQAATVTAAVTEASFFAVGGLTRSWVRLAFTDSAATVFSAFFNIASGYVGTASAGVTPIIVALGNNQFRCVIRFTPAAGAGTLKLNISIDGSTISYAGTTTNGVYLWGGQVTTGTQTPYISTTSATRSISAPDRDRTDPMAYLLEEEDPQMENSETGIARRVFGRIPREQTVPDSLFISKPEIPGEFPQEIGSFIVFQPVSTEAIYDAYAINNVTSDSGAVTAFYPTGGTYTLTFAGDTTAAKNYNDSAATVETALDGLSSVSARGGVTLTGSYNSAAGITVTFNDRAAATLDTSSLVITNGAATASTTVTLSNGGYTQSVIVACSFTGRITSGTFTVTVGADTTAPIAFNATVAAVQTAINLLASVTAFGGCTVSAPDNVIGQNFLAPGQPNQLRFTITYSNAVITSNSNSLTPAGSAVTATINDGTNGKVQTLTFSSSSSTRTVGVDGGHNISSGDTIYVRADGTYYPDIVDFAVNSSTTVTLTAASSSGFSGATSITEIGKLTIDNYTPGIKQTRCNRVTTFYLPGVTPGITTAADIPLPTYQGDPASLLAAIFSGSTSINYQVGELIQWMNTPILQRTITTLNASQL